MHSPLSSYHNIENMCCNKWNDLDLLSSTPGAPGKHRTIDWDKRWIGGLWCASKETEAIGPWARGLIRLPEKVYLPQCYADKLTLLCPSNPGSVKIVCMCANNLSKRTWASVIYFNRYLQWHDALIPDPFPLALMLSWFVCSFVTTFLFSVLS